jgi:hypothetical protein
LVQQFQRKRFRDTFPIGSNVKLSSAIAAIFHFISEQKNLNFVEEAGMVPGWVPFKIVSDSPALHSRWPLLLKIEISSIVHCCFSISQNELKFKLQLELLVPDEMVFMWISHRVLC